MTFSTWSVPVSYPVAAAAKLSVRLLAAAAFVGVWIAAGFALHLRPVSYLLLGVPLTIAFQLFIARRPLAALWVRDAAPFDLRRREGALLMTLAAVPLWLVRSHLAAHEWLQAAWAAAALLGAAPAAFAVGRMRGADGRALLRCLLVAGTIGVALVAAPVLVARAVGAMPTAGTKLPTLVGIGVRDFLSFVPIVFVLEEVSFRGLLDAWVHPDPARPGIGSAIFVSALWGLWHLPVIGRSPSPAIAAMLLVVHVAIGVPLTVFWRRTGNLAVPGVVHAFIDGVRDAVLMA